MAELEFVEQEDTLAPRIKVIGVGGGGSNAVDGMMFIENDNVEFYVINTDVQALQRAKCANRLQIGKEITYGRGAGSDPIIGEKAALAAKDIITEMLQETDMLFITAGFGGGTGTGAAPVIAEIAGEMGILTIGFVTRPFRFEGPHRMKKADLGLDRMKSACDTLVIISNERLLEVVGNKSTLTEAFEMVNQILAQGVKSISELITVPGLINVDFGDVKSIMSGNGGAVMGVGVGKGENRAAEAVNKACANPLLDKNVIDGASSILLCVTGGENLKLDEINQATTTVYERADENVNITLGVVIDPNLRDEVKVTIIATGFGDALSLPSDTIAPVSSVKKPRSEKKAVKPRKNSTSFTLKEKLESMLAAEKEVADEELSQQETFFKEEEIEEDDNEGMDDDFLINFNKPENPLRRMMPEKEEAEEPEEEKPQKEDDLDSPAFIRRRKNLFE